MHQNSDSASNLLQGISAVLFDLDGVITKTSTLHARAWKQAFDEFLASHAESTHTPCVPFDAASDYAQHVDGKRRADGVRDFLTSRGIHLPEGTPDDPPHALTVNGVGNHKNELVLEILEKDGVETYSGSIDFLNAVKEQGLRTGLVSSSANARQVLETVNLSHMFDVRVDGAVARERHLAGKPSAETYLFAAELLNVEPGAAMVIEDAVAGVEAGRAGNFRTVLGVDRLDQEAELLAAGADLVVRDLSELFT